MTSVEGVAAPCAAARPTGRRFYIHQDSLRALVTAQPDWLDDVVHALVLSAASRAAASVVEEASMFDTRTDTSLTAAAARLTEHAAEDLAGIFQSLVHFEPPDAIEPLLAENESIKAWCYDGGYFTYATDETSATIMYLETGSLRQLRSRIRRDPEAEPQLKMISGPNLFVMDRRLGAGRGGAAAYRSVHRRRVRDAPPMPVTDLPVLDRLGKILDHDLHDLPPYRRADLKGQCVRHAVMTLRVLGIGPVDPVLSDATAHRVPELV